MGCNASTTNPAIISQYSAKSPAVDSLSQENKRNIRKILQKDDVVQLAIIMAELCTYLIIFSLASQCGDLRIWPEVDAHSFML